MSFKKFDGSTWQPITPKKLKGIPYTGTLPATLTGTKAGYLHRYKIYGNTEQTGTPAPENPIMPQECGERTKNLCYRIITNATIDGNGRIVYDTSFDVALAPVYQDSSYSALNPSNVYAWFMAEPYLGSQSYNQSRNTGALINKSSPLNGFVAVRYTKANSSNAMVVEGSTALPYEPYGYKLPLTSAGQDVDIYIGDDTLSTEEYVDSGTGKIYRMVGGVLTPTDPPMPFPQIPTSATSTTISWAGEGLAPSEFDSVQEWVDTSTYTYTNGAWVENN